MEANAPHLEWQRVVTAAEAGELFLDPAVGRDLEKVCDDYLTRLEGMYLQVNNMQYLDGFGGFPSAQVLQDKFSSKATGDGQSLTAVLLRHMDAVMCAKQAVAKAIQNFVNQDLASGDQISGVTP